MHPTRAFAIEFIKRHLPPGSILNLLDVGCGDGEVVTAVAGGAVVHAFDHDDKKLPNRLRFRKLDAREPRWPYEDGMFDTVISTYCLQHLGAVEAHAWGEIGRVLRPGGLLAVTGRYAFVSPVMETGRGDPLRTDNEITLRALGLAGGMRLDKLQTILYADDGYKPHSFAESNAFGAVFTRDIGQYRSTVTL